jgi:tetratricopeptide (TPR) repeat protein
MTIRLFPLVVLGFAPLASLSAQPAQAVRSHVERFRTPEVRAERAEADANTKLTANPNDDVTLNAGSLARMRLGRYNEAYEDLRRAVSLKPDNSDYQANLGYVLWKLGRVDEAVSSERAALKLDQKNTTAHQGFIKLLVSCYWFSTWQVAHWYLHRPTQQTTHTRSGRRRMWKGY